MLRAFVRVVELAFSLVLRLGSCSYQCLCLDFDLATSSSFTFFVVSGSASVRVSVSRRLALLFPLPFVIELVFPLVLRRGSC